MASEAYIDLDFFLGFGRALRAEGLQLGSAEIELFIRALAKAAVKNLRDIYWVGRVCLTSSAEQIPIYDRVFQQWFQNMGDATFPATVSLQQEQPAISRPATLAMEVAKKPGSVAGRAAAWDERLGSKRIQPPDVDELLTMQVITNALNACPAVRRSRRFRAGGRNGPIHVRRILRTSYRTGGEFFRLIRSRRLVRVRPLVLLIDVSKSMTAHSRAFVQFARAALRRKGRTEVLCFGTQLTAVTKLLRTGDATAALERTSVAVQDWDGGTRLSSALEELFLLPRQTQSIRGAIVILLSDGLERGSCQAMAKHVARLSRLAHRLIWINPLCADPLFEPRAGAIRAILPFADKVYGSQDLNDLAHIVPNLFTDMWATKEITAVEIIDAHHHIWQMKNLPWLMGEPVPRIFGQYDSIRRDYPIEEYLADIRDCGVSKTVYVQVNWIPHQEVDETRWVQTVADKFGIPNAIVGFADLARPDLEETLGAHLQSPLFRGIRQQLHWHLNPQYRFASRPDLMNDNRWRRGFASLEKFGLVFELQIFASQMVDGARLARDFPETVIVLEHAGMLEDRSEDGWKQWRAGMRLLARSPNVYTKISGLGTFLRRFDRDAIRPVVLETIEIFGADRCMFGSNFPIEKIWTDYRTLFEGTASILDGLNTTEKAAVLGDTAQRVYRPAFGVKYG